MAFATVADVEVRWKTLNAAEKARCEVLLADANAKMIQAGADATSTDESYSQVCKAVCCQMVIRAMQSADFLGLTSESISAGEYSQSYSYANPTGDLYLTAQEKRDIGVSGVTIINIHPKGAGNCDEN